jgi:hypothetical protein
VILIRKNSVNNNILTLSEKTTLNNVVYLFEIINDQTKNNIYFIAQDISGNKERFNEFNITDNVIENHLLGVVNFPLKGFSKYNIYEQISTTNLSPVGLNLIDKGKLKVIDISASNVVYNGNQTNYIAYGS